MGFAVRRNRSILFFIVCFIFVESEPLEYLFQHHFRFQESFSFLKSVNTDAINLSSHNNDFRGEIPEPPIWPEQFHAVMFQNMTNKLALVDLYYDWPNGRNLNKICRQLSTCTWDVEWTNGTSYYFDPDEKSCQVVKFPVGIVWPDWLKDAKFLGTEKVGHFDCYVWTKLDFITYYEDIKTRTPVRWNFHSRPFQLDILSFKVGEILPAGKWQAPNYCFNGTSKWLSYHGDENVEN